jgi:hypothetical protein
MYYPPPKLTPEERKMPLAKYFEKYPLMAMPPLQKRLLDFGAMDPSDAVPIGNWLDLLKIEGYGNVDFGYCMMPDGSGYYEEYYATYPGAPGAAAPEMSRWYTNWINFKPKGTAEGQGNLRYKLWCHLDHWDHAYVNGKDGADGVWSLGTLDLGKSGLENSFEEIAHTIDLRQFGLTGEREKELKDAGCSFRAAYEEVPGKDGARLAGGHLLLGFQRTCPFGGREHFRREWIGYTAKGGKITRAENTPCSEEYLKNVLIHNVIEHMHAQRFLPELYAEYHDKPMDAD